MVVIKLLVSNYGTRTPYNHYQRSRPYHFNSCLTLADSGTVATFEK